MANKKASSMQFDKKDPFKRFSLIIAGNKGVNQTMTPEEMDDAESLQVINLLPIGNGLVRKVEGYTQIAQLPADIVLFVNEYINGSMVKFLILSDGSAGILSGSPLTYSSVAPAGTFSTDPSQVDITTWEAQYLLIADANKGYFAYQPGWTFTYKTWTQSTAYN
ncbi:MAG TPA: hypothetical protein ENO30_04320, partial [Thermodesulfobium narugense]|nr:hypothetical protein [Thermodesulfobium narugense]